MHAEAAHRPWYRRPRRVVLLVILLVVLAGGVVFGILWSRRGAHEASLQSAVDKFRKQGQAGDAAFLRPAVGVYTYEGTGTEKLSVLATTQHWGPRLPATVTRDAKGCWTLRVEYSTNHYQEWDECPTTDALQETGGRTYQSFDFVAAHISDLNEFKCTPRADTIRVKAQPGQRWHVSCDGHSTSRGTTVTSAEPTPTSGPRRSPSAGLGFPRTTTGSTEPSPGAKPAASTPTCGTRRVTASPCARAARCGWNHRPLSARSSTRNAATSPSARSLRSDDGRMKPAPFQHHAPETIDDAVALLAEHGDEAKPLAGGQSLVPMLALRLTRFEHLVDLERVGALTGIEARDGTLRIGAMTRQREVERSAEVARAVPLLARAVPLIGHFQIRNRGTIGGSLAHADPASELPAVALALDATMEITGPAGTRTVPAANFFVSTWTTALADDELLTAIHFPARRARSGFAVEEVARRAGDFALAGIACAVELGEGDQVARVALARFGLGPTAQRAPTAEAALTGSSATTVDVEAAGHAAVADADPVDDVHASGHYRKQVGAHLAARVLATAISEARGA